jgi:hypothetical protein
MTECCPTPPATPPAKIPPVEFCTGNYTIVFQDGRMVKVPRLPAIPDGVYLNPTLTLVDGCITKVETGTNVVYSACDPCVTPVAPPTPDTVVIDGSACNMTMLGPDGLLTQLAVAQTSCIAVAGCGTAASPLAISPIISPDADNALQCRANGLFVDAGLGGCPGGANFAGCGIVITNGCITQLPLPFQPILNLYNDDGTMTIDRDVANPCTVRLRATTADIPSLNASTPRVDNVAALPVTTTQNGFAVVGVGPGPGNLYTFVTTIGWLQVNGATVTLP